jgi:TetR/AcrR family transcriptional regulator, transcriptional repressor for nem operon
MTRADENRQRIIAAAAPLFNTRGYAGTSMSDVLEAVGLHKGSVYLCFPSKEDLASAVFDYSAGLMLEHCQTAIEQGGARASDQLLAFIDLYTNLSDQQPIVGGCPILNAAIESDDAYPFLRERVAAALRKWQTLLKEVIEGGIARGEFSEFTDANRLAALLIAGIEGALMMTRALNDVSPMRAMVEHLKNQVRALSR